MSQIDKPSETALFAALRRTLAFKDYPNEKFGPDYIASHFLPLHFRFFLHFKKIRTNTKNKLEAMLPGLNAYLIARTAFFDNFYKLALKAQIPQIVILGAGYDSRPYRFSKYNQGSKIFELDSPATQIRKKKCLKKAKIEIPSNLTFVPIDFNSQSLTDTLSKAGYEHTQATFFVWEGVSYYLNAESIDRTLKMVSQNAHEKNRIAFDYMIPIPPEEIKDYFGVEMFLKTMKKHHQEELLLYSISEHEITRFLAQRELIVLEHFDNHEIEKKFLLDHQGDLLARITGLFRFVVASPLKNT